MKKKFISVVTLIIILLAVGIIYIKTRPQNNVSLQSELFTGAALEVVSDEEKDIVKQGSDLRLLLPIRTDTYKLDFNYKTFKFEVGLKKPYDDNKQQLDNWLAEQGFEGIPQDQFKYILE